MTTHLPFSQACENNKGPILERLREVFNAPGTVLEIGSGTGQHAVHFAHALPHLQWQPTERPGACHLASTRLKQAALPNILPILELDAGKIPWPVADVRWAFSANTAHIMGWDHVEQMFRGIGERLADDGAFCLYGPFNHRGQFTSESNREFDQYLRSRAPHMGIRDIEDLSALAETARMALSERFELPANNGMLVFRRTPEPGFTEKLTPMQEISHRSGSRSPVSNLFMFSRMAGVRDDKPARTSAQGWKLQGFRSCPKDMGTGMATRMKCAG